MTLTDQQLDQYHRDGFLSPLSVFSPQEARLLRERLEALEARVAGDPERLAAMRNNSHWVVPLFDQLARTPAIVEPVSALLGQDLLALHVDLFIKEPGTSRFISWHQDLHYWGLDSEDELTAWLALSPATPESGCMRFLPGSHRHKLQHRDTFAGDNMLSRGQELALEVDESEAVFNCLQPGQVSLHHGRLAHASCANTSNDRRIGVAIRYVTPAVGLARPGEKPGASLVRGRDSFGHFDLVAPPAAEFEPAAMDNWRRLREIEQSILHAPAA